MLKVKEYKKLIDNPKQFAIYSPVLFNIKEEEEIYAVKRTKDEQYFEINDFVNIPNSSASGDIFSVIVGFIKEYNSGIWVRKFILNSTTMQAESPEALFFLINEVEPISNYTRDSILNTWEQYRKTNEKNSDL